MKQEIISFISTLNNEIFKMSRYLYENPEKSYEEYKSCSYLVNYFKGHNFNVTESFLDIPTAFRAEYGSGHPKICYICHYDTSLNDGFISGHNLISSMSAAASAALCSGLHGMQGTVIVLGCPGEQVGGAMITMVKQGVFNDIDAVIMAHPDVETAENGTSKAILPVSIKFSYSGASSMPDKYSTMDASLFILNSLNFLCRGFDNGCSVDRISVDGGIASHGVRSASNLSFYIRTPRMKDADLIHGSIGKLAKTVSEIMNMESAASMFELPYEELIPNRILSRIFFHNLKESGLIDCKGVKDSDFGVSLGTVSHLVPCIQPYVSVVESGSSIKYGTTEFAAATTTEYAHTAVMRTAQALALTGFDLIEKNELISEIKSELASKMSPKE